MRATPPANFVSSTGETIFHSIPQRAEPCWLHDGSWRAASRANPDAWIPRATAVAAKTRSNVRMAMADPPVVGMLQVTLLVRGWGGLVKINLDSRGFPQGLGAREASPEASPIRAGQIL